MTPHDEPDSPCECGGCAAMLWVILGWWIVGGVVVWLYLMRSE